MYNVHASYNLIAAYLLVDHLIDVLATRLHRTSRPADRLYRRRRNPSPLHEALPPPHNDAPIVLFEPRVREPPLADIRIERLNLQPPDPTPPATTHNTLPRPTRLLSVASVTAASTATTDTIAAQRPAAPRTVSSPALDLSPAPLLPMSMPMSVALVGGVGGQVPVPMPVTPDLQTAATITTTIASMDELLPTRDELIGARLTLRALVMRRDELDAPPLGLATPAAPAHVPVHEELRTPPPLPPLFALEAPPLRHTLRWRIRRAFSNVLPFLRSLLL